MKGVNLMNKLVFLYDPSIVYEGELIKVNPNVLRVTFTSKVPTKQALVTGMNVINEHNGSVMSFKEDYKTIYRTYADNKVVELSNDGSVWRKPLMNVCFKASGDCSLNGETIQKVHNYEELAIPTPIANENYKFVKWNPEIPKNGEVKENKTFVAEFEYVPTKEELLEKFETAKEEKIAESKAMLADYLEKHPLVSNCHGNVDATYTVTSEKQALMTSNYMKYTLAKQSGLKVPMLKWNASGCECEVWTEEEFVTLILQVAEYVEPLVALQQFYEVQISACTTHEELDAISIVYDTYGVSEVPEI